MNPATLVRRLVVAMIFAVVVYGVFVVLRGLDAIGGALATYDWSTFALALGLTFANYVLRFGKWEFYLARLGVRGVPKVDSFLTFLSGFVLTVTPGKVGEVFKSLVLYETHGTPMARTAPIVVAERLTDVIGVVVLVIVGSLAFPGGLVWAVAGGVAVLAGLALISSQRTMDAVVARLERSPGALGRVAPRVREAWGSLRTLTSPGALALPTLLSVASWSLEALALWAILRGLGAQAPGALALFVYATSTLAGALIPVPGGLGVTEGLLEQQLARLGGVPIAASTSAMILVRFATLWFAVLLGFSALGLLRLKFPGLLRPPAAEGEGAAAPGAGGPGGGG
ncbi:MAG TPA: lysylphosphatidylglycerol synthase transmembrane domain-containing protein [Polyangiaceae bacterium]|nr:lysylphosphatidylglycerol synthase transmembrane domain-containing protein [Polyangiaceae bacterium]